MTRIGRRAEQSLEIVVVPRRGVRSRRTKGCEDIQSCKQSIRVKVVKLLKDHLAGRRIYPRREAAHDVIEVIDIDSLQRPTLERSARGRLFAGEVSEHEQAHRFGVVSRTTRRAVAEVEASYGHRKLLRRMTAAILPKCDELPDRRHLRPNHTARTTFDTSDDTRFTFTDNWRH
jgi:hypothetical protein